MSMDKRKIKHQQSIILRDLTDLENIAKSNPENDLDQTFQMLQERLQQRYESLKREMAMPNQSDLLREIDNLKYEAQQITNDPERLKQVHRKVGDLKTEVLFAPSPPKLNIEPLIQLIDHMGIESDSEEESPPAVTNIRDLVPSQRNVITPDTAVPSASFDRQHSSNSSARVDRQFSDSSERQRVSSTRTSDRQSELDRSRNDSLMSGTSNKPLDADRKYWRSEQKPTEFPSSADTLLTPGAFTTSQPKPTVTSRPAGQHGAIKPDSPVRRAPSPLQTRSATIPSPVNSNLSSHHQTHVSSEMKQPYSYYNPQTRTIELRDNTPEHKMQDAEEGESQRSIDHLKSTPVRDQYDREYERRDKTLPPAPRVGHSTLPLQGSGPQITDLCSSNKVRRYFTEVSDMTSSPINCSVQELYNPSMFFVLSPKGERAREDIQEEVFKYITANRRNLPVSKSHSIGELVLCKFSADDQWYRACVIDTFPDYVYKVLFIDFGNFEETSFENLCEIPEDFVKIKNWPMCVQQCYLSGITTPGCKGSWDHGTTEALWDLVSGQNAVVRATESEKEVYGVVLEISTNHGAININEKLVEMGLAEKKKGGEKDQMNGLCTSPTLFSHRTPVDDRRSNSYVPDSQPLPRPVSNSFSHITDSRPPPKNFAPVSTDVLSVNSAGITDTRKERRADPKGGRSNRKYTSSEDEEAVGRPATPETAKTPPYPESMRSSGRGSFGGGGGPVGRSNVFADQRTRGSRRPENSTIGSPGEEVATRGETSDYNQETTPGNLGNQYSGRSDNQRWDHASFRDDGPPPNFTISHKELENTTASLSEIGKQINDQTFDQNNTAQEEKCPPQFQFVADQSQCSNDPGDDTPRSTQHSSSEVVVLGSRDPSQSDIPSPRSEVAIDHDIGGSMDALESDELPAGVDTQIPVTLTDALKHIKYDPKSYLLEDLTVETVYASHKAGEHTRMEIESVKSDARFLPVLVTCVISPELFYVTVLNKTNISIQEKVNESLDLLFSNKRVWQEGDKVSRNVAGEVRTGEVVATNKNLLEIQWAGGDEQVAREWLPEHLVEETVSLAISAKLKDLSCRVEFAVGEFCTARYTWRPNEHTECVSWYRAMVLHVIRKKSRGPGPGKIIKYHVQYVDYGNMAEVDVKHVRPLPAKFLLFPAQAIPCTLPEIEPKRNDVIEPPGEDVNVFEMEDEEEITPFRGQYSQEAISHFRDLVYEERVYLSVEGEVVPLQYGYQTDKTVSDADAVLQFCNGCLPVTISDIIKGKISSFVTEFVSGGFADRILNLESRDLSLHPVSSVAIEDKVKEVERKLALMDDERESTLGAPSVNSELSSEIGSDTLSTFDPMSDDYNSETNLVDNDRNDLGQAVFGQKLSQRTLCRYFSRGRKCYKGDKCKYLHQTKSDFNSVQSGQAMIAVHKPLTPTNDMPIVVQVTSVLTAFHFWAQILPHHINPGEIEMNVAVADPLTQLKDKMNVHYKFRGNRERKYYPAIGELVAVKSKQGNGDFRRSRVTETDDVGDRKCKVFHVDFGTFEVVPEESLRLMEPDFVTELPFQAVEMLLADIRPAYSTSVEPVYVGGEEVGNNKEEAGLAARDFFLNRVTDNWLVAKVIERVPEGPLLVHLWDTSGGEEVRDWRSINKELVDGGHAESIHPLPEELTTDCGTLASSNFHDSD